MSGTQEMENLRAELYCSHRSARQWLWETKAIRFRIHWADYIDSTLSGFGVGIDNISDLNSQPRPCCGSQDVDTVLEFVFGVRHYQVDLDVSLDKYKGKSMLWQLLKHFFFISFAREPWPGIFRRKWYKSLDSPERVRAWRVKCSRWTFFQLL